MAYLEPDEERAMIEKCIGVFKKLTGAPPKGWLSPVLAPTAHTGRDQSADTGFLWYGDYNHIDLPFCVNTAKGTLVALPHSDFADHRVLRGNPRDWYDVYKDTFDFSTRTSLCHTSTSRCTAISAARPLMAAQVDRILKYIRGFPGAWFVRHDELAQWIKKTISGNGPTSSGFSHARREKQWALPRPLANYLPVNRGLRLSMKARRPSRNPPSPCGGADRLDRGHVALVGILSTCAMVILAALNRQRRVIGKWCGRSRSLRS